MGAGASSRCEGRHRGGGGASSRCEGRHGGGGALVRHQEVRTDMVFFFFFFFLGGGGAPGAFDTEML